jgi:hypothetical protein
MSLLEKLIQRISRAYSTKTLNDIWSDSQVIFEWGHSVPLRTPKVGFQYIPIKVVKIPTLKWTQTLVLLHFKAMCTIHMTATSHGMDTINFCSFESASLCFPLLLTGTNFSKTEFV